MKQKAAHQNILYSVHKFLPDKRNPEGGDPLGVDIYFFRYGDAVAKARWMAPLLINTVSLVSRHTIDFGGTYKLGVLKAALEGKAQGFIVETERLEAWGKTLGGKVKRVNLRGARWKQWDGSIR